MYELKIGEVILNNDMEMVVIDCENRENMASMSYDRSYKLCLFSELEGKTIMSEEEFKNLGYWIQVKGTEFPEIERPDIPPFEITPIKSYKIRQKQPKTITVYE